MRCAAVLFYCILCAPLPRRLLEIFDWHVSKFDGLMKRMAGHTLLQEDGDNVVSDCGEGMPFFGEVGWLVVSLRTDDD